MNGREKEIKYWAAFIVAGMIGCYGPAYAASTVTPETTAKTEAAKTEAAKTEVKVEDDKAPVTDDISREAKTYLDEQADTEVDFNNDPLERFNRVIFSFNDFLDRYVVKPVATFYNAVMPKPLNTGVHNFFTNLNELPNIANDILQFNAYQFANDIWRFSLNSTFGLAGFIDIATRMRLPYHSNDFGLTLAKWGYQNSTYLVFPFLGPSTFRDGVGLGVDYFVFSVYPHIEPQSRRFAVLTLFYIDHRANLLQFEPVLEEAAIDKYVFMRNAYMQHRQFQIEQAKEGGKAEEAVLATGESPSEQNKK